MLRGVKGLCLLLVSLLAFVACSNDSTGSIDFPEYKPGDTLRTATLVYMMAENNLNSYSKKDIAEMCKGAMDVPHDCAMFAFVDDVKIPRILRFYNDAGTPACDTIYTYDEDFCSSDINELEGVFEWLLQNYPARELNVVLWSHGDGWLKDANRAQRVIGFDNGLNSSSYEYPSVMGVEIQELAAFFEALPVKIGFIMFDACFMQGIEVIYELRNCARWIIASPAEIPAYGAPYDKLLSLFFDAPFEPSEIVKVYSSSYPVNSGVLLSVVDCSKVEAFADATAPYISKYFSSVSAVDYNAIFQYLRGGYFSTTMSYPCYFDMNGAMMLHLAENEYKAWKKAFDKMVPYSCAAERWSSVYTGLGYYTTNHKQYGGVSMYLPRKKSEYKSFNKDFSTMEWYERAGWGNAGW